MQHTHTLEDEMRATHEADIERLEATHRGDVARIEARLARVEQELLRQHQFMVFLAAIITGGHDDHDK